MKIENLITQYLLLNKKISLQEIGILYLDRDISAADDAVVMMEGDVRFVFDLKAPADEGFVSFVMEKTRKIRPLASSDVESYMMLGKQFLNIGKPFVIKELGVLLKNQQHVYEFSLGQTAASKIESTDTVIIEKEKASAEIDFSSPRNQTNQKKKWLPWVLVFSFLLLVVLLYLNFKGADEADHSAPNDTDTLSVSDQSVADTNKINTASSGADLKDSTVNIIAASADSFYVVVRASANLSEIKAAYQKLSSYPIGKGLVFYTDDSVVYKIAMPIHQPLSDSTAVRDSLKINFGKAIIEIRK